MKKGPANNFTIANGQKVTSYSDFKSYETNNKFDSLIYLPDKFGEESQEREHITNKIFENISFKDTSFNSIYFVNCSFDKCLLLSAKFINCEFSNCKFYRTNTNKAIFENTFIDPLDFKDNFNLKDDTNIAINLYQSLYKNLIKDEQQKLARQSLYMMYTAENAHLSSRLKRGRINRYKFIKSRTWNVFHDFATGYGIKLGRVLRTGILTIVLFSYVNYIFRSEFESMNTFIDSLYFTVVTLTTLGFGDIHPISSFGKFLISLEVLFGIFIISLALSSVKSHIFKA